VIGPHAATDQPAGRAFAVAVELNLALVVAQVIGGQEPAP